MEYFLIICNIILLLFVIYLYNNLINQKNKVHYAFAGVDVALKKRSDLVPNLVASVKAYAKHEEALFTKVTEIRNKAITKTEANKEKFNLENTLTELLKRITVIAEDYPDLKANENFLQLQQTLSEIEEQLSAARRAYNAMVLDFNNSVEMFPSNIMAKSMNYTRKESFSVTEEEKQKSPKNIF